MKRQVWGMIKKKKKVAVNVTEIKCYLQLKLLAEELYLHEKNKKQCFTQ